MFHTTVWSLIQSPKVTSIFKKPPKILLKSEINSKHKSSLINENMNPVHTLNITGIHWNTDTTPWLIWPPQKSQMKGLADCLQEECFNNYYHKKIKIVQRYTYLSSSALDVFFAVLFLLSDSLSLDSSLEEELPLLSSLLPSSLSSISLSLPDSLSEIFFFPKYLTY